MKKILIANDFFDTNIGGVEIFIKNLENLFSDYKIIKLATYFKENESKNKFVLKNKQAINIFHAKNNIINKIKKYKIIKDIKNIINFVKPDVVIACKINQLYLFNEALKNDKSAILIGSLHGFYETYNLKDLKRTNCLCVLSNEQKDLYLKYCKNIKIALNPILLPNLECKKEKLITCISRIDFDKRVDIFVKAVALIQDELTDFSFIVAGDGALFVDTKKLANKLNARIKFLGHISQNEVFNLYAKSKINVLSSAAEGYPYSLIEPMNYECTRISTKYKGETLNILIDNEKDGLICELNEEDLAKKILHLAKNEELRLKLAKNAKEKFKNLKANANDFYLQLVKELLNE